MDADADARYWAAVVDEAHRIAAGQGEAISRQEVDCLARDHGLDVELFAKLSLEARPKSLVIGPPSEVLPRPTVWYSFELDEYWVAEFAVGVESERVEYVSIYS